MFLLNGVFLYIVPKPEVSHLIINVYMKSESCSVMFDSVTPGTAARQAPLSMEFSRPEYWSG